MIIWINKKSVIMRDSVKANLIIFFIVAIIAFGISSTFAKMTIPEETDSYKLISIENNSFKPNHIDEVPTIIEKPANTTNITNTTYNNTSHNNTGNYSGYEHHTSNKTNTYSNYTKRYYSEYW